MLNQWLIEQCGFDPLAAHKAGKSKLRPLEGLAKILWDCPEGTDTDNLHHFYKNLDAAWPEAAQFPQNDLLRYEQHIVRHTLAINEGRSRPIVWKYYQWLSLLFVEIYLDRYFGRREQLLSSLNGFIQRFNAYWKNHDFETGVAPYSLEELNKLCLQNATGSGKTLLMHINFLQFHHYAQASPFKDDWAKTLLITPNEGLSEQHQRELDASGIRTKRLENSTQENLTQIDFTEITKLSDEGGPRQIAIGSLGDQNLLLVDEAHRGMGSKEETGWFRSRERLVRKGFVFEYSATFKEAAAAAKGSGMETDYTKNILLDYSYCYFYEDGYGKDYRIFNLPKSYEAQRFVYLTACLLSFYQQLKLYEDKKTAFMPYNLEKPLWVFVGKSVSKAAGTKDEKETVSDVARILQFIAHLLKDEAATASVIEKILHTNAQDTGLLDETGNDIFAGSFLYIRELKRQKGWEARELLRNIFEKVFLNAAGGQLTLAKIKGDEGEIMLRVGQEETPFGLINVGDAAGLIKHIEQEKEARPKDFGNLNVREAEFSETLFGQVHESSSSVTVLLGAKKFVEGWDCWRVSTLGLMRVGKSEGSQIIQLFGRGVRLKGYNWTLKRSGFATPAEQPEHIQSLETLNVFGVQADFMEKFKKFLEDEGLPSNDQKAIHTLPLHITYDFGKSLKVLRPRKKDEHGNEYDFKKDGRVPNFGELPHKLKEKKVIIDWYPRIQALESNNKRKDVDKNDKMTFSEEHLAFLDFTALFFRLEQFKRERTWHNLNISKQKIKRLLLDKTWYRIAVPEENMAPSNVANVFLWQEMACELLQKYCDEFYNHAKAAFTEPRLELRPLAPEDGNFPHEKEYQLIVDSSEQALIQDILALKNDLAQGKQGILKSGDLKACLLETHLYQPVMRVAKNSKIQIAPVSLNASEFQFVEDLREYVKSSAEEFYLLRNESRGKGMGFFEAGNFYPDFLLWKIKNGMQYLAFVEPHGLLHEGPGHKKIEFHKTIKKIQQRLSSENVCLNSFIVTPTKFAKLNWNLTMEELEKRNVFFMKDSPGNYIAEIVSRMEL